MSLLPLPTELTIRILTFLDPADLVKLRSVNSFFKSLINESTALQYRVALFAYGMVDGPPGDLTTAERLNLLRNYEAAWKNIEWSEHHTIPYSGGVAWEFYGNVWGHSKGTNAIDFVQLPSRLRGVPLRQWTLNFDFHVRHFSMDPSQDLLITIEYNNQRVNKLCHIQFHTLSTGEKHPLAGSTATIEYTPEVAPVPGGRLWISTIRICGEHLAILFLECHVFAGGRNELVVWNWRTGVQKLVVLSADVESFVYLNDNLILTSTSAPPALLVYSLEQRPDDEPTWDRPHLLRFLFGPRFRDPQGVSKIVIKSDPSPGCLPSTGQVPFQIAGDERMIALYSRYFDSAKDRTFLIPMKSLLGRITALLGKEVLDVDWELHSPAFIEYLPVFDEWDVWIPFLFGLRYITPTVVYFDRPMIVIRDLCQRRCLRASKEERDKSQGIYEAITWSHYRDWVPYPRTILKCVPFPESIPLHENTMLFISEDNIVVVEDANDLRRPSNLHLLTI